MISFLIIFKIYNEKYIKIFLYHCYSLCQYSNFKIVFQKYLYRNYLGYKIVMNLFKIIYWDILYFLIINFRLI